MPMSSFSGKPDDGKVSPKELFREQETEVKDKIEVIQGQLVTIKERVDTMLADAMKLAGEAIMAKIRKHMDEVITPEIERHEEYKSISLEN